jgi:hypothetical protein
MAGIIACSPPLASPFRLHDPASPPPYTLEELHSLFFLSSDPEALSKDRDQKEKFTHEHQDSGGAEDDPG